MFIVYTGLDEIFVTTPEKEPEFLKEYGEDRNFQEDYDRNVLPTTTTGVKITSTQVWDY